MEINKVEINFFLSVLSSTSEKQTDEEKEEINSGRADKKEAEAGGAS
jgi:hypothetical protein